MDSQGRKTGGRKKGTRNKITRTAREAITLAAEGLGGVRRLVEWAQADPQNERVFWGVIYTKLVPNEIVGPSGGALEIAARVIHEHLAERPALPAASSLAVIEARVER